MWQTKYASAVPKNLGVGVDFFGCAVKAISSPGVRSPWLNGKLFYVTMEINIILGDEA